MQLLSKFKIQSPQRVVQMNATAEATNTAELEGRGSWPHFRVRTIRDGTLSVTCTEWTESHCNRYRR
jgi:hypothetical protein